MCNNQQKYIQYVVNSNLKGMIKINCFILLLLIATGLQAQEILTPPLAKLLTRFPFKQFSGGVIVIEARFGNIPDTLNFVLDTGSGGISLDSATCDEFKIPIRATDTTITGFGGVHKVSFVFDQTLNLPGLKVEHLNFHINNYEVLSSVYGEKVDGIIGYSFFSRYIVKVNFDSSFIEVYNPGRISYPRDGTILRPAFTNLPIQWMTIRDRRKMGFNFYIDTGAGLCFLMSERFAEDSSILFSRRKPVLTQAEGMGGKLQMRLTVIKEVRIGPYRFRGVPTYLYKDDHNITAYPFTGGLLGNDLLRRFNMIFNYPSREIHLIPNTHFSERFDYAYTGLGIYYIEGKVIVEDVIEGSPADKAKFKVNDEIVGVDKNLSGNIQAYKNILQTPNASIKVIVKRANVLKELTINTRSIR